MLEAVALFATVELGLRSLDARDGRGPDVTCAGPRRWRLLAMVAGAAVSAFVALAVGSRRLPAPTAGLALGLAAAASLLLLGRGALRRRVTAVATATDRLIIRPGSVPARRGCRVVLSRSSSPTAARSSAMSRRSASSACALGEVGHQVGETVGDRVELVLRRLVVAGLAVLQQRDHAGT